MLGFAVQAHVFENDFQSVSQTILNIPFYDPSSDVSVQWNVLGEAAHFEALDDGVRNTSMPDVGDYIHATADDVKDVLGLPTPDEGNIARIILWVYAGTGKNSKIIVNVKNDNVTMAMSTLNPNQPEAWRPVIWDNPPPLGAITVEFISKKAGGSQTDSKVYASYIEVVAN